ncbi:hypothetical protein MUG84_26460 [Paenibacillus sp. KQZ6P-2]|uniref:Uncharacterized protein n=1 Tax=Paenibacillus mangrovi TaxID=2931978 RepID=A0A9X1WWL2_9BACL|nr:hypothetical protein [Paenibacillus mangrovi]MCJ8015215.1 hypothetical protein [Paenibacillus mangrovi]
MIILTLSGLVEADGTELISGFYTPDRPVEPTDGQIMVDEMPKDETGIRFNYYYDHVAQKVIIKYVQTIDEPTEIEKIKDNMARMESENALLKAQNTALSDRADFIEDCIAEMAQQVYQ